MVKQAGVSNGFRIVSENQQPYLSKELQKVFFCCERKEQKCLFRLQYMRRTGDEPFKFHKARDLHNHDFLDPKHLKPAKQTQQSSEKSLY